MKPMEENKKQKTKPVSGNVIVEYAPISERMWSKGDEAMISNGQIKLSGCWFNFDNRYVVKACA